METKRIRRRWARGGAWVGAGAAVVLGWIFTLFLTLIDPEFRPPPEFIPWAVLLIVTGVLWGLVGAVLGAIMGVFASMLWVREE